MELEAAAKGVVLVALGQSCLHLMHQTLLVSFDSQLNKAAELEKGGKHPSAAELLTDFLLYCNAVSI